MVAITGFIIGISLLGIVAIGWIVYLSVELYLMSRRRK